MYHSIDQKYDLEAYLNSIEGLPFMPPKQALTIANGWCIKNWGSDRLRVPPMGQKSGNAEWNFLHESHNGQEYFKVKNENFLKGPRF